jgi:hypothetical protein
VVCQTSADGSFTPIPFGPSAWVLLRSFADFSCSGGATGRDGSPSHGSRFHVAVSFGSVSKLIMHGVLLVVLAYFLFRPQANACFRSAEIEAP